MLDDLDRGLIHALQIDGRAPWRRIAAVLDTSTQTVARRYRRLRAEAGLRVVGLPDPRLAGHTRWLVRLTATPSATRELAHALARRTDTSWVRLLSGGTEICVVIHTDAPAGGPPALLLRDVPRRSAITAVSAQCLLHTYRGGASGWPGRLGALDPEQVRRLRPPAPARVTTEPVTTPPATTPPATTEPATTAPATTPPATTAPEATRRQPPRTRPPSRAPHARPVDRPPRTTRCSPHCTGTAGPATRSWPRRPAGRRPPSPAGSRGCGRTTRCSSTSTSARRCSGRRPRRCSGCP
jgi:cell division septation protein DedD